MTVAHAEQGTTALQEDDPPPLESWTSLLATLLVSVSKAPLLFRPHLLHNAVVLPVQCVASELVHQGVANV